MTLRKAVMLDSPQRATRKAVGDMPTHSVGNPRRTITAQQVADETAARLRTAAQRGNPNPRIGSADTTPMSSTEVLNFVGSRKPITLESLAYPAIEGQRRGTPASGGEALLGEKAAKASRIAKVALDPHALPADRAEAAKWCRAYIKSVEKIEAIKAAGRVLAGS